MTKRYFWLKFKEDFFDKKLVKKLRSIAGGDTFTIIYLKMQLKSIRNQGILKYEGIEDTFAKELALDIDEDVENVKMTLAFLQQYNMIEQINEEDFILNGVVECIGSETDSAERVRNLRKKKKELALHCNNNVTNCNVPVTTCNTDIDIDIDIDKKEKIKKEFETLWKIYPGNKTNKSKCLEKYIKYRTKDKIEYGTIKDGLDKYIKYCKKTEWYSPKNSSTWFNNKSWEDEMELEETKKKSEEIISEEKQDVMKRLAE